MRKYFTLKKLSKIPNINRGGCGIAVYVFYKWLVENKYDVSNFKIYWCFHSDDDKNYNHNKQVLEQQTHGENLFPCDHALFSLNGGNPRDSGETVSLSVYEAYQIITPQQALNAINNNISTDWNLLFDRKIAIPLIEKQLNISLSEIVIQDPHLTPIE